MDEKPNAAPMAPAKEQPHAEKLTVDELVAKHLEETSRLGADKLPESHLLFSEHVDKEQLAGWEAKAVLARFYAHGLRTVSRLHPEVFAAAMNAALHGRV